MGAFYQKQAMNSLKRRGVQMQDIDNQCACEKHSMIEKNSEKHSMIEKNSEKHSMIIIRKVRNSERFTVTNEASEERAKDKQR